MTSYGEKTGCLQNDLEISCYIFHSVHYNSNVTLTTNSYTYMFRA